MPLDPQAQALIASVAGGKPVEQMTPQEMRDALEERVRLTGGAPEPVDQVVPGVVPGPAGPIVVRIYTPKGGQAALPGLVYLHGGGWARGSLQTHDIVCRSLANGAGCVVVSVDYRMAPEHRFPAAFEDSLAATRWVAEHAAELGIDPRRLAVGGDSAGGNLAAAVALAARDAGGPSLVHQLLIYPVTDYNFDTRSYADNAEGYMLTRAAMQHYWRLYLRDGSDGADFRASPLRARDFGNLPPALVITAEFDPLRDEGRAYADRLREAGTPVLYREYPGMVHGFVTSAGVLDAGKQAVREAAAALKDAFRVPSSGFRVGVLS
ncbi:MAG: alpha/beta hydrolase [Chloroflexi bacterium]|nr:MAG: alpha/beta hydrolase [Chloroflexota bacterium]